MWFLDNNIRYIVYVYVSKKAPKYLKNNRILSSYV